jgi:hypothetical protein
MLADQHTLDHLAFARGMRPQILASEWAVSAESDDDSGWQPAQVSERQHARFPRGLAYALVGLFVVFSLSGPLLFPSTPISPIAAWQTR